MGVQGQITELLGGNVSIPIEPVALHGHKGDVFLGAHQRRDGMIEIVFERAGLRRSVWHIRSGTPSIDGLQEACRRAINAPDPLGALYAALFKAGIQLECVDERFMRESRA
jgi:hypothetical protein